MDQLNRAYWLIKLRWVACACVAAMVWFTSSVLVIVPHPGALYAITVAMFMCNLLFTLLERRDGLGGAGSDLNILIQIAMDQVVLTLLLYFSGISHNPFIFYFVFHMIIAALLLRGRIPYLLAALASFLVGAVLLSQYLKWIPTVRMNLPHLSHTTLADPHSADAPYLIGLFVAFSSTLWITVYFASSVQRHVNEAQDQARQKEKMLGIGQLVAGIAHQINNPLDGLQNCLRLISQRVTDDAHLSQYVRLMTEALERIERTAKRVQSFARPRGLKLQDTDVNKAVEAICKLMGNGRQHGIKVELDLGPVPAVKGDPFTLQEVIFNLYTNALAAMEDGGTLTIRTHRQAPEKFSSVELVVIEVADTGVGIPEDLTEKVFEPFFTTRSDSGGTGLGLGLCRMMISEMGGHVGVESQVGRGTTFQIALRVAETLTKGADHESPDR